MKITPSLFALLLPTLSVGAVSLQPGQTIVVEAGSPATQVSCEGPTAANYVAGPRGASQPSSGADGTTSSAAPSASSRASGGFCHCRPAALQGDVDFQLVRTSFVGNERQETSLKRYAKERACDAAIANYPACR